MVLKSFIASKTCSFSANIMWMKKITFLLFLVGLTACADRPCLKRAYKDGIVCVCNAEYCDDISRILTGQPGDYVMYSSSKAGQRFSKSRGKLISTTTSQKMVTFRKMMGKIFPSFADKVNIEVKDEMVIEIYRNVTYQEIYGFGGSFPDSTGINFFSLSPKTQENFINSYFSEKGLEYNMGRVAMGGTDFSTHAYTYNEVPKGDINLTNFTLSNEDYQYKLPLIHRAKNAATDDFYIIASAWSPPTWMKTNNDWGGPGYLLKKYYRAWADYHYKFIDEYNNEGVNIWAITTGNQPFLSSVFKVPFNILSWLPENQAKWVAQYLGPTIKNSIYSNIKILAVDDIRLVLYWWMETMARYDALKYIDGMGMHWYGNILNIDKLISSYIDIIQQAFPNKFLLATEACISRRGVMLGSWERGEQYIADIMTDLNNWFTGWIDWNLALNSQGGPNWVNSFADSPVIVFPDADEFVKQPMFYVMGHFSKFIPRGSLRVKVMTIHGHISNVAFLRPDGGVAIVFYNSSNKDKFLMIREKNKGAIHVHVPAKSIHTVVYW